MAEDWAPLIGAVEDLVVRVSALESLLEGRAQHLRSAFFTKFFGLDLLPSFRQVRAQHAASMRLLHRPCMAGLKLVSCA